jgi:hypothetical protein
MSFWGDVHRRSRGEEIRKEDDHKYMTMERVEEILKKAKVDIYPFGYPPYHIFKVLVEDFLSDKISIYTITAASTHHPDGTRNFYSEPVLDSFKSLMEKNGNIIQIDDFRV